MLDCLQMTYATLDLEAFPRQAVAGLRHVVSAPFGSYNEIDHRAARISYVVEPAEACVPNIELAVRQYVHEHPVVANYRRTGDGSPRKLSDFLTRREFHRLSIYNETYRRTGVEHQITFMLRSLQRPSPSTIAIALDRGRGDSDFTDRERLILSLLRPHLITAYANAETVSAIRRGTQVAGGEAEARRREIVILRQPGRHLISPRAASWLAHYFSAGPARASHLPDSLERWIREQGVRLGRGKKLAAPAVPLVVEGGDTRLRLRLVPESPDDLLVLEQEQTTEDYAALKRLGLTARQAEALYWAAEGKTNPEIGIILHTTTRTVAKHLQRVFKKLDVDNRTSAALIALRAFRGSGAARPLGRRADSEPTRTAAPAE
jgi:DNA-binding CsgD family transcriptional regulator